METSDRFLALEHVELLGIRINALSLKDLISGIEACIAARRKVYIAYVNVHAINVTFTIPWFRSFLNKSYMTFCDGFGVQLAAWFTRQALPERFTPPDFMEKICDIAEQHQWRLFFLGAKPGVAQRAAEKIIAKFPGLQIQTHHGFFNKAINSVENGQVLEQINQFQPQILILGFGMPLQEKWIIENLPSLQVNIAFPAGAMFDYISGEMWRPPRWITDHGLEWLSRLAVEPRRLWKRYVIGNPLFFWRIFVHHFLRVSLPE